MNWVIESVKVLTLPLTTRSELLCSTLVSRFRRPARQQV